MKTAREKLLEDMINKLENLLVKSNEISTFYGKIIDSNAMFLHIHHVNASKEEIEIGKRLRDEFDVLKQQCKTIQSQLSDLPIEPESKDRSTIIREFVVQWGQEGMYDKTFEKAVLKLIGQFGQFEQKENEPLKSGLNREILEDLFSIAWKGGMESNEPNQPNFDVAVNHGTLKDAIDTILFELNIEQKGDKK